ncbi:MAG: helix-turn-helix transcriptional regulator [Oricola sp.]
MHKWHPTREQIDLANVLSVLGDPTRLAIVAQLARDENRAHACGEFSALGSKTKISYHLSRMREAGITNTEVAGTSRLITLRREDLDARFPGLLDSILAAAAGPPPPVPNRPKPKSAEKPGG